MLEKTSTYSKNTFIINIIMIIEIVGGLFKSLVCPVLVDDLNATQSKTLRCSTLEDLLLKYQCGPK